MKRFAICLAVWFSGVLIITLVIALSVVYGEVDLLDDGVALAYSCLAYIVCTGIVLAVFALRWLEEIRIRREERIRMDERRKYNDRF